MRNEMMHRPVVQKELVQFMRENLKAFPGELGELERYANEKGIPIIPHETAVYLNQLVGLLQPEQILEIGTAIGFSASLMAQRVGRNGHVTTVDRFDVMIAAAKQNFQKLGVADKVTLLEGDAADILPGLTGPYDFIFMDSAKQKYVEFLPHCMRLLRRGGVLLIDDVFQGGTILEDEKDIPRRVRRIHRKLNRLMEVVLDHPALDTSLIPLGDGLLQIVKQEEDDFLPLLAEFAKGAPENSPETEL